ncbi:MAG: hemolysin family protein [Ruthenibacterium sp.]
MDPDGLSILLAAAGGVLALIFSYAMGAVCADDAEKDRETCLGFSNAAAGIFAAFVFACVFFAVGFMRLFAAALYGAVLCDVLLIAAAVCCYSIGLVKGDAPSVFLAFAPLGLVFAAPAKLLFRVLHLKADSNVTEEDLLSMVDDVEEQSLIDESQKEMITNIFELDDVTAGDIMTHRTELVSVPETALASEVVALVQEYGFSRIPVYRKSMDDIVGILYAKDLFALWNGAKDDCAVSAFMRTAMFVPEACRARELLIEFKVKHTQIAVVVDEYGGTSGLVTMEDILEEIVGNIQDEFDDEEEDIVRCNDGIIAAGNADLEDVFDALNVEIPAEMEDEDFDSVGGLVIDRFGRIPAQGEEVAVPYGGIVFTVLEVDERRVAKVKCTVAAEAL